ncbi:Ig-like domain-containing protein, partial [Rhizobium johnstonii]
MIVQGPGGAAQTITITDPAGSAWTAFNAAALRPVALGDTATTDERHALTIDALGNDTGPELSIVAVRSLSGQGEVGIVDNRVTFTPSGAFN